MKRTKIYEGLSNVFKFLDPIDIFRVPVTLTLNKSSKTSTIIGKMFTFAILSILIYTIMQSDALKRENPKTIGQDLKLDERPLISLSKNNFSFAVGVSDSQNNMLYDPSIFSFYLTINRLDLITPAFNSKQFILKLCEKKDFVEDPEKFEKLKLQGSFCLPNEEFDLKGYWNENNIDFMMLNLIICQNSTLNNNSCKSVEEIENFLKSKYINLFISNPNIDVSNFSDPFSTQLRVFYQEISIRLYKLLEIYLKKTSIITDYGWFFEMLSIETRITIASYVYDVSYFNQLSDMPALYTINLYSSDETNKIMRIYQKIQDVLAQFGGMCNVLIVMGIFLSKFEKHFFFTLFAMNKLYNFQIQNNKINNKKIFQSKNRLGFLGDAELNSKISNTTKNMPDDSSNPKLGMISEKTPPSSKFKRLEFNQNINFQGRLKNMFDFKSYFTKGEIQSELKSLSSLNSPICKPQSSNCPIIKTHQKNKNNLKFSFCNYLKLLFKIKKFRMNEEEKLFILGEDKVFQEMDLFNLIKKLQDVEKLKKIVLNEDQLFFFDLFCKPTISLDKDKENDLKEISKRRTSPFKGNDVKFYGKKNKFYELYEKMKNNPEKTLIDQKILNMVEDNKFNPS